LTSEVDLLKDGNEYVLVVVNIIEVRVGSTCDVNYKIALLALVKEAFTAPVTANVTITITGISHWPLKNKDVIWVQAVVHLPGQLGA